MKEKTEITFFTQKTKNLSQIKIRRLKKLMKETVKLILEQIKMLEHTYDFAVGETGLRMDSDKEDILKALRAFTKKVEQTQSLEEFEREMEKEC